MKKVFILLCITVHSIICIHAENIACVRVNLSGYLPESIKVGVFLSDTSFPETGFTVRESLTEQIVFQSKGKESNAGRWGMQQALRLDFSELTAPGGYYIECNGARSPYFRIDAGVYAGSADFLLRYMRQQRCGYNPYLKAECHQHDGYIVGHPARTGDFIDVRGGWHDASDYLQYLPTSANATFQMLFAWQQQPNPSIFKDEYNNRGEKTPNGVPDILDEARWGLEWMLRMNPDSAMMFNQIADDRDHASMRLPNKDSVDYGWGKGTGRPVYFITGQPQGLGKYKNRTTGVSSSAAKFASAFALGAEIFRKTDPGLAEKLQAKALPAYRFAEAIPGNTQTACLKSPYFYEEDNYTDDMELAAATQYSIHQEDDWKKQADYWGQLEDITPWMELGRARHYQYYPFVNLGHYYLASSTDPVMSRKYTRFMQKGLECMLQRALHENDPFLNGIPFIWCSNNLATAAITQARLYHQVSGDTKYLEMEAALRDWLLGCNPWGTSMICGYPEGSDSPTHPHSAYVEVIDDLTYGGLVDGPIYRSIYESLLGIHLKYEDPYAPFQHGAAVYHDDPGDYSSNEPTMDGTASLSFYLSSMEKEGQKQIRDKDMKDDFGAIIRKNTARKSVYLVFPADLNFEGVPVILQALRKHKIKASFFLTGNCLRAEANYQSIREIIGDGHFVGGHSDKHIQYAEWKNRSKSLVTPDSLLSDFRENMKELSRWNIEISKIKSYLPPFEWYNAESVKLIGTQGQSVVNYTPGIPTAADYTTPDMPNYRTSQELIDRLFDFEAKEGLNGAIILIHPGTVPERTDKLYLRLDEIIRKLQKKGYTFSHF